MDVSDVVNELNRIRSDQDKFIGKHKTKLDETHDKTAELQARLQEVERKVLAPGFGEGGGGGPVHDSYALRALLEGSTELQAVANRKSRRAVLELPPGHFKAQVISTGIVPPQQVPGVVAPAQRRLTVRQLLPSVPATSGSYQYLRETGFTNAAAITSEGESKPESNLTFQLVTGAIVTIAHWIRASAQVLSDISQLMQYIDGRLRYGLAYAEELQLLKGSGVGNNLSGIYTQASAFTGSGGTRIDMLRQAITQLALVDFQASGIVLHPTDWEKIQLAKDSQGRYIVGDPSGANMPTLWSLPVIPTAAMTVESFMVAAFDQVALIYDREDARVDISTETDDDFVTNRVHIRAEERLGLAVLRPEAAVKGDFGS